MAGFTANVDELHKALRAVAAAAKGVETIHPATALGLIGSAMAGSASATAAEALSDRWNTSLTTWAQRAHHHSEAVASGADGYTRSDETHSTAFEGIHP